MERVLEGEMIGCYARGMTTREIPSGLQVVYGVEVSPTLISAVTDSVLEDVKAWQSRPLDAVYPIVYLDAIHVKMRSSGHVLNTAVYVALAINLEGEKELLGFWIGEAEGSKLWLSVLPGLKNRGAFPTPESVGKVMYLAKLRASERWNRPVKQWAKALKHLAVTFEGRVSV